jgi:hypothetical protein
MSQRVVWVSIATNARIIFEKIVGKNGHECTNFFEKIVGEITANSRIIIEKMVGKNGQECTNSF